MAANLMWDKNRVSETKKNKGPGDQISPISKKPYFYLSRLMLVALTTINTAMGIGVPGS